jgi:hypothetical protein
LVLGFDHFQRLFKGTRLSSPELIQGTEKAGTFNFPIIAQQIETKAAE